jgi:hypothetical protein
VTIEIVTIIKAANPALGRVVLSFLGRTLDDDIADVLRHMLKLARSSYAAAPANSRGLEQRKALAASRRVVVRCRDDDHPAGEWSCEEAYLRSGVWSGGQGDWTPSDLGGTDVRRRLQSYRADIESFGTQSSCKKFKQSSAKLIPGAAFWWCTECGICLMFGVMAEAESPKTVFDLMFTRSEVAPTSVCYDNGCNLAQYALNREPAFFKDTAFFVDNPHFKTHANCATDFDTSQYACFTNSPLAEQKNSILRSLETSSSYMNQTTFLLYTRHFVYKLNKIQRAKANGTCFWHRNQS